MPSCRACQAVWVPREERLTAAPQTGQISNDLTFGSATIIGMYSSSRIMVAIAREFTVYVAKNPHRRGGAADEPRR